MNGGAGIQRPTIPLVDAPEHTGTGDPNPDYGGRTALRGLVRPQAASSVSWLSPSAFSRGWYLLVGLTSVGIRLTGTSVLACGLGDSLMPPRS